MGIDSRARLRRRVGWRGDDDDADDYPASRRCRVIPIAPARRPRLFWREIVAAGFTMRRTMRGIGAAVGSAAAKAAAISLTRKHDPAGCRR
jgi:hypothetical protein